MIGWLAQKKVKFVFLSVLFCLLGSVVLPAEALAYENTENTVVEDSSSETLSILTDIGVGDADTESGSDWPWQWTIATAFGVIGLVILSVGILRWSFKGDNQEMDAL